MRWRPTCFVAGRQTVPFASIAYNGFDGFPAVDAGGSSQTVMPTKRSVILIALFAGFVLMVMVGFAVAGIAFLFFPDYEFDALRFESTTWKYTPSEMSHESLRLRMVDDFLATHSPVGTTRDEIIALLGQPDDTEYFRDFDLVYHLGRERSVFGIDSEWLVVRLDDNSIVKEARIVSD